jgi:hypothetical protein
LIDSILLSLTWVRGVSSLGSEEINSSMLSVKVVWTDEWKSMVVLDRDWACFVISLHKIILDKVVQMDHLCGIGF